jgi:RNA recognition motif-containing protein
MPIQVHVGNLSPQTTQGAIRRLFQPYGYISSVNLMADNAGRPSGFAFVTMDASGAGKAITALHKKEVDGRNITAHIRLI